MWRAGTVVIAALLAIGGHEMAAQTPLGYRAYMLASSVGSVVRTSGARETDVRTIHERPALLQRLEWRTPYLRSADSTLDPVRDIAFRFVDDQLYEMVVTYDRQRTSGLTDDDVITALAGIYGAPHGQPARGNEASGAPLARWEVDDAQLVLTRSPNPPEYQLVLTARGLGRRAAAATADALRLDAEEAPQRALDRRAKDAVDVDAADRKTRLINLGAFRP